LNDTTVIATSVLASGTNGPTYLCAGIVNLMIPVAASVVTRLPEQISAFQK